MQNLPALSLSAVSQPGRRLAAIELAREAERRGCAGVYCSAAGAGMALCHSLAHATSTLRFGTAIVNIYSRNPLELAQAAAYLHEVSAGRFALGLGVSHEPFNAALGVQPGRPLGDMRQYVARLRGAAAQQGALPPLYLAALRQRMTRLAAEVAEGAVFANVPRSRAAAALEPIAAPSRRGGFFLGNIIPVCIAADRREAEAVMRRTVGRFVVLPYYRKYWKEAGYAEEMARLEELLAEQPAAEAVAATLDAGWLDDVTLFGTPREVRDGVAQWQAAGITPILAPSSTSGDPLQAFAELFAAFT